MKKNKSSTFLRGIKPLKKIIRFCSFRTNKVAWDSSPQQNCEVSSGYAPCPTGRRAYNGADWKVLDKIEIIILGLIVLLGFGLRLIGINKHLLWVDEAETVINTQQILEVGYPHGEYKGKPIFENSSYIPSNSDKYEYESTNYFGSKYERNKGWLTYYYLAGFLKIFGFSNAIARLPYILLGLATIILIFLLGRLVFNANIGLLAAFIHAVNFWAIFYEKQARYYALFILLSLLVFYFYYRLREERKFRNYFCLTIFLVLLFHTHLVAAAAALAFVVYNELVAVRFKLLKIYERWKYWALIYLAATFSWWLLVEGFLGMSLLPLNGAIESWWLEILLCYGLAYFAGRMLVKLITNRRLIINPAIKLLINYLIIYLIIAFFLIPKESFVVRVFLPILPFLATMVAYLVNQFAELFLGKQYLKAAVRIGLCLIIFIAGQSLFYDYFYQINDTGVDYIRDIIKIIEARGIDDQTMILVNSQVLSYQLYYDYNTDLVWPVRKSYIDTWPGKMYLVFFIGWDTCGIGYPEKYYKMYCQPGRRNYSEKILSCQKQLYQFEDKKIELYSCPAI